LTPGAELHESELSCSSRAERASTHRQATLFDAKQRDVRAPFTFFEASSINFAIVVYACVCACRSSTCIENGIKEGKMAKKAKKAKAKKAKKKTAKKK